MTSMRIEGLSFNFQLYSTGLTQITNQKQNQECFGQAKGKNENDQCIRLGFEQWIKGDCLPSLITNSFFKVNISRS